MINRIGTHEVYDFKERYCNENEIIAHLLEMNFSKHLISPILDVGAGTGDIAYKALRGQKVIMIDVNPESHETYPCLPNHSRYQCDFFEYRNEEPIGTVLISHTLQFIDDSVEKLNHKIRELAPKTIITILNTNEDFMGELIIWAKQNFENPNPEYRVSGFPYGYSLVKSEFFQAELKCPDFATLARQVAYLMLVELSTKESELVSFLKLHLTAPRFIFSQSIDVYQKNG